MPGGAYPKIVDLALKKLAFDLPEGPDTPTEFPRQVRDRSPVLVHFPERRNAKEIGESFAVLESAIRFRKRVTFTYQTAGTGSVSRRDVDPFGLVYREASWVLVGWCHLRKEIRSFRVDRMRDVEMAPKPKSPDFDRPEGFDVREYAHRSPWTFAVEPPEEIELAIRPEAAEIANDDFGPGAVKHADGEHTIVRFTCTNPDFAVSRILAAKGAIAVRSGERLRRRVAAELEAVAARYQEVPGA
jgi:predicted DNA-binding transcriptional regulator YafY